MEVAQKPVAQGLLIEENFKVLAVNPQKSTSRCCMCYPRGYFGQGAREGSWIVQVFGHSKRELQQLPRPDDPSRTIGNLADNLTPETDLAQAKID